MITLSQITKTYGLNPVLRGVDLVVAEGEFVAVMGPNGAGKSTLMRILTTLVKPTAGQVTVGGWTLPAQAERVRRNLGYISHHPLLYGDLSALENLLFFARLYGLDEPAAYSENALRKVGLFGRRHDPVRTFSRGMTQRLTIARATLHDPAVLLLDEPYTGLDQSAADALDRQLAELHAQGRTIVLITHDVLHGWRLADRVAILNRGIITANQAKSTRSEGEFLAFYREQIAP